MRDDDIGPVQGAIEIQRFGVVGPDLYPWHETRGFAQNRGAAVLQRVAPAPAVGRLINRHLVAEADQLARDATEKMRITVIPAGHDGMIEQHELHADASADLWRPARRGRTAQSAIAW